MGDQPEPQDQWDFQERRDQLVNKDQRDSQEPTDNKKTQEMLDHQDFQDHPPSHHGWEAVFQTEPPKEEMKERSHFQKKDHPHQRSEYQKTTHSSKSTDTTHPRRSMMRRLSSPN